MKMLRYYCIAFFLLTILSSCSKDDDSPTPAEPVMVNFEAPESSAQKSVGEHEIRLVFDQRATRNGLITIKAISETGDEFHTIPALKDGFLELEVMKGDKSAAFVLDPQKTAAGDKSVSFEITGCSEGFEIHTPKITALQINDDHSADDDTPVSVSFASSSETVYENESAGIELEIFLSAPAQEKGTLRIELEGEMDETVFRTEPAMDAAGSIDLSVEPGDESLSFMVFPQDDERLIAHHDLKFVLAETTRSLLKGDLVILDLRILDDELAGKAKTSEVVGEHGMIRKTFEYDQQGRINRVLMETDTFDHTHNYYYNVGGQLEKINYAEGQDQHFFWQDDRLLKTERMANGVKTTYCEYEYDQEGNIAVRSVYQRQVTGEFELVRIHMYNYHQDNNLRRVLTYHLKNGKTQSTSTRTWESYRQEENRFPAEAIIPGVSTQFNLPASLQVDENGETREYTYDYEFDPEGRPFRRSTGSEEVTYAYY